MTAELSEAAKTRIHDVIAAGPFGDLPLSITSGYKVP